MRVEGRDTRSIQIEAEPGRPPRPVIIDQTRLPHELRTVALDTLGDVEAAIRNMQVRGAPLIGATAAYGVALAMRSDASDESLHAACRRLLDTRPTGVNLQWAVEHMLDLLRDVSPSERETAAFHEADEIAEADVRLCRAIGDHGLRVLIELYETSSDGTALQVLTHCNAGWLATVDWGTALSPVYRARREGLPLHIWVSETRPRNQGASLTAWELGQEGVPHTVVPDNASGHLLRTGRVDVVLTGTDRTTAVGDVCNKIGTYMKAVAAHDNGVPFYVAVPGPSIDWTLGEGEADRIPIEERDEGEVAEVRGLSSDGMSTAVRIVPADSPVANFAFDVTPGRLVTGLITERGVCRASREGLLSLYAERGLSE
jgi:methylthioribose-1-phosphate isomerase